MRLSDRQALILFEIAKDTTNIAGNIGGFGMEVRLKIVNDIIQQQDNTIVEVSSTDEEGAGK